MREHTVELDYLFSARLQVCVSNAFFISVSASSSMACVDWNSALQDSQKLKAMGVRFTIFRFRLMIPFDVPNPIVLLPATLESAKKRHGRTGTRKCKGSGSSVDDKSDSGKLPFGGQGGLSQIASDFDTDTLFLT